MRLLILFLFFLGTVEAVPPAQERLLQANKYYEQGEIKKAYEIYKGIAYKSPEVLVNMGNAAYELGFFPEALVRWRQAQKYVKPSDYRMLEKRITDFQLERGGAYHSTRIERIARNVDLYMRLMPYKMWQLLFLIVIAFGFFLVSWIKKRSWSRMIVWFCFLWVIAFFLIVRSLEQNRLMGFVLRDTNAYVNKDVQSRVKVTFSSGQEIQVCALHDSWYLITDGLSAGWAKQQDIHLV